MNANIDIIINMLNDTFFIRHPAPSSIAFADPSRFY